MGKSCEKMAAERRKYYEISRFDDEKKTLEKISESFVAKVCLFWTIQDFKSAVEQEEKKVKRGEKGCLNGDLIKIEAGIVLQLVVTWTPGGDDIGVFVKFVRKNK